MGSATHATSQWNICSPQVPHRHGNRCAHQGQVTNAASPTVRLETKTSIDGIQKQCVWQLSAWSDSLFHLNEWMNEWCIFLSTESRQFKQNSTLSLCGGLRRSWLENRCCPSQRLALSHCLLGARRHPASEGWTWEDKTASINSD